MLVFFCHGRNIGRRISWIPWWTSKKMVPVQRSGKPTKGGRGWVGIHEGNGGFQGGLDVGWRWVVCWFCNLVKSINLIKITISGRWCTCSPTIWSKFEYWEPHKFRIRVSDVLSLGRWMIQLAFLREKNPRLKSFQKSFANKFPNLIILLGHSKTSEAWVLRWKIRVFQCPVVHVNLEAVKRVPKLIDSIDWTKDGGKHVHLLLSFYDFQSFWFHDIVGYRCEMLWDSSKPGPFERIHGYKGQKEKEADSEGQKEAKTWCTQRFKEVLIKILIFLHFFPKFWLFHESWGHDRTSERVKPQFHLGFKAVEEKSVAWMLWCAAGRWMMMMISLTHKNRSTHIIFFDASFSYENPRCSHWKPKVKSSWRLEVMNKNIHPNPLKPRRCWTWGLEGLDGCFVREKRKGNDGRKWRKDVCFWWFLGWFFVWFCPAWKSSWPNEGWPLGWSIDQGFPTKFFIDRQRCCGRSSSTRFHGFPLFKGISSINSKFG